MNVIARRRAIPSSNRNNIFSVQVIVQILLTSLLKGVSCVYYLISKCDLSPKFPHLLRVNLQRVFIQLSYRDICINTGNVHLWTTVLMDNNLYSSLPSNISPQAKRPLRVRADSLTSQSAIVGPMSRPTDV